MRSFTVTLSVLVGFAFQLACSRQGPSGGVNDDGEELGSGGAISATGGMGGSTSGGADTGGTGALGSGGGELGFETGPIRPERYRISDAAFSTPPCDNAGDGTLSEKQVLLGQTHLTPIDWPFQTVSENRPLTIAVAAEGSGVAPSMTATVRMMSRELTICLEGPPDLGADAADLESATYRAAIPAEWVHPGMEIDVEVAGVIETVTPSVAAENGLTVYFVEAELFGEGTSEPTSKSQWTEFLARLPSSFLDVGTNPFGVWRPQKLLIGPRDDGRSPNGDETSHGAIFVDENPHCTGEDEVAGTCTPHSGYGIMSAVLSTLDTFREANGMKASSTWYAKLGQSLGGGLAGGQRGTGDDSGLTMNHELGHAWGFPHWAADHTDYPYEGVQRERGGFGDAWALDQVTARLLSTQCEGLERQSPMQRSGSCVPEGSWFDPFSDYEAARLLRMTLGASSEILGEVAYSGGTLASDSRSYVLPTESGREHMLWNVTEPGLSLTKYDEASGAFVEYVPDAWNRLALTEVPVVMFSGAVIMGEDAHFESPISYVGNILEKIDPAVPTDYATLYEKRSSDFYWASDLHLRFTLADQTTFTRIYGGEAVLRQATDHVRFAFNLPKSVGDEVAKVELLSRPLGHYSEDSRLDETTTADTYYENARVIGVWEKE